AEPPHLLLQVEAVAAHDRTENHRTTAKLRRAQAALAGAPGALLLVRLLGRAADVADAFGLVGAGAALGELPVDDAGEDVAAHRQAEHCLGQLDIADFLIIEIADGQLHGAGSPADSGAASGAGSSAGTGASASLPSPLRAAGKGNSSGALRLTASLISTQPPSLPGTAPLLIR